MYKEEYRPSKRWKLREKSFIALRMILIHRWNISYKSVFDLCKYMYDNYIVVCFVNYVKRKTKTKQNKTTTTTTTKPRIVFCKIRSEN